MTETSVRAAILGGSSDRYRQLGRLSSETPGFAPPPHDGFTFIVDLARACTVLKAMVAAQRGVYYAMGPMGSTPLRLWFH